VADGDRRAGNPGAVADPVKGLHLHQKQIRLHRLVMVARHRVVTDDVTGLECRDIGIVGFDDSVAAHMVRPALSSVNQPLELAAEHSLRMLLGALGSAPGPEGVLLTPSLVVRASSVRSG